MKALSLCLLILAAPAAAIVPAGPGPSVVSVDSRAALVPVRVVVGAGSAQDPKGLEGVAALTAELLIQGSFGAKTVVDKDRLAELTRPLGSEAYPSVSVGKETTVFTMLVPRDGFDRYVDEILAPMLNAPLFDAKELDRLRQESLQAIRSRLRLEDIEQLGLVALDNYMHAGTRYAHPLWGSESGLKAITRSDIDKFYRSFYLDGNITVGLGSGDAALRRKLRDSLKGAGRGVVSTLPMGANNPERFQGRHALIIGQPNAIASGIHAGLPISVKRGDPDYWPLYVANIWFGAHRDGVSHLFQVLREQRGYNYGDYSYIEHFEGRPSQFFPPPGFPRRRHYFSIWVRPVAHEFVPHVVKAITWELERLVRDGIDEPGCALAKSKAKVLYLSLAENSKRLLGSKLDDSFYDSLLPTVHPERGERRRPGYLDEYLERVEGVSCAQMNAALRAHLKPDALKYLIVTKQSEAAKIAERLLSNAPAWGKAPAEYQIDAKDENGVKTYIVPEPKLELLRRDAVWAHHPLDLAPERVRVVPAEKMFETAALP